MSWKLNSDRPIYAQIIEEIQLRIVSGEYRAGQRMPSVRELAAEAEVNPNTMQKALAGNGAKRVTVQSANQWAICNGGSNDD